MAYLLSFSETASWITPNRNTDWLIEKLTKNINDQELINFIEVSTYINGVNFFEDKVDYKLKMKYLDLLQIEVPNIIKQEKHPLVEHLKELDIILKQTPNEKA